MIIKTQSRLDTEPTYEEIYNRCAELYGDEYLIAVLFRDRQGWVTDVEHEVEQQLFKEKSLTLESSDAITVA